MFLFRLCAQLYFNWMGIVLLLFLRLVLAFRDGWLWQALYLLVDNFVVLLRLFVADLFLVLWL